MAGERVTLWRFDNGSEWFVAPVDPNVPEDEVEYATALLLDERCNRPATSQGDGVTWCTRPKDHDGPCSWMADAQSDQMREALGERERQEFIDAAADYLINRTPDCEWARNDAVAKLNAYRAALADSTPNEGKR